MASDQSSGDPGALLPATRQHNRYTLRDPRQRPPGLGLGAAATTATATDYAGAFVPNKTRALDAIVDSIERTGTRSGSPVHGGTHAWIVLGYRAEVDPDDPTKRTILGFYVTGPLGRRPIRGRTST